MDGCNSFVKNFSRLPYFLPNKNNFCSSAIIVDPKGKSVDRLPQEKEKNLDNGMFVVPKLRDSINGKTYRYFFIVPRSHIKLNFDHE